MLIVPSKQHQFFSMSGMEEVNVSLYNFSSVFYSFIQLFCPVHQSMVAAAKNTTVFFSIRAYMCRGLVTASDLKDAKDERQTATQWLQKISDNWQVSCPEGKYPSTPSKIGEAAD